MRNALLENQIITLLSESTQRQTRTFEIVETLGCGFSCLAYRATDSITNIPVVVKECFPCKSAIRELTGSVSWSSAYEEDRAKSRFRTSYETQREIQSSNELMNTSTHLIDGLFIGNNTLYNVCIDILEERLLTDNQSNEQLFETFESLIEHSERIDDIKRTTYYKRRRQELLGVEFEIE